MPDQLLQRLDYTYYFLQEMSLADIEISPRTSAKALMMHPRQQCAALMITRFADSGLLIRPDGSQRNRMIGRDAIEHY